MAAMVPDRGRCVAALRGRAARREEAHRPPGEARGRALRAGPARASAAVLHGADRPWRPRRTRARRSAARERPPVLLLRADRAAVGLLRHASRLVLCRVRTGWRIARTTGTA